MLPHLAADVGENLVTVLQLNAKHRIGQGFDHATLNLDGTIFLGHYFSEILRVRLDQLAPAAASGDNISGAESTPTTKREPVARNSRTGARKSRREHRTVGPYYPFGRPPQNHRKRSSAHH